MVPPFAFSLKTSRSNFHVPKLSRTPILNDFAYIQKIPNVIGDDRLELDAHLAQVPMRLTSMVVDLDTNQASLILRSSFTGKLGHWAQQKTEALYSLNCVTQLVDLIRPGFVIKDYHAENLNMLAKFEQGNSDVPDYIRNSMTTIIVFGNLKFPKNLGTICILWVFVLDF
jgi:hypothetical protein